MKFILTYSFCLLFLGLGILKAQEEQKPIIHTVEKGNTIYSLSREYKVSVLDIKTWNDMKSNNLSIGDELIVGYENIETDSEEEAAPPKENYNKVGGEVIPDDTYTESQEKAEDPEPSLAPKEDEKNPKPASLEDIGTSIDEDEIYNISLETVEEPAVAGGKDLGEALALPKPTSLIFCGGVDNGEPIGVSTIFYPQQERNYFYVYLENNDQFDDTELIVELYQKEPFSRRFNNHKGTKKYAIKARWKFTNFKFDIPEPGEYRMMVYTSEKQKLAEGVFVILEK